MVRHVTRGGGGCECLGALHKGDGWRKGTMASSCTLKAMRNGALHLYPL